MRSNKASRDSEAPLGAMSGYSKNCLPDQLEGKHKWYDFWCRNKSCDRYNYTWKVIQIVDKDAECAVCGYPMGHKLI